MSEMVYFLVSLHGLPTAAKTELTTAFQTVHEYYMGCNTDGSGPDELADHYIRLRTNNLEQLQIFMVALYAKYQRTADYFQRVDATEKIPLSEMTTEALFARDYETPESPPRPYTYSA